MNYLELKNLARRTQRSKGGERKRLVEKLMKEPPKLDFEGYDEFTIWLARLLARLRWA